MSGQKRSDTRDAPGQVRGALVTIRWAIGVIALMAWLLSSLGLSATQGSIVEVGAWGVSATAHSHAGDCSDEPGVRHCHMQVAQARHGPSIVIMRVERSITRALSSDRMPPRFAVPPLPKPPRDVAA